MTTRYRLVKAAAVIAPSLAIAGFLFWWFLDPSDQRHLRPIPTPFRGVGGHLLVRGGLGDDTLLFIYLDPGAAVRWSHSEGEVAARELRDFGHVQRYRRGARSLEAVPLEAWERLEIPCAADYERTQTGASKGVSYASAISNMRMLVVSGKTVDTAGQTVLWAADSPDGKLVAVLSTAEKAMPRSMGFRWRTIGGERLHEVRCMRDGRRVGRVLSLRGTGLGDDVSSTWSSDGRFVVYHDMWHDKLWVAEVSLSAHECVASAATVAGGKR